MANLAQPSYWIAYCDDSDELASDEDNATKGLGQWHGGSGRNLLGTLQLLETYLGVKGFMGVYSRLSPMPLSKMLEVISRFDVLVSGLSFSVVSAFTMALYVAWVGVCSPSCMPSSGIEELVVGSLMPLAVMGHIHRSMW